MREMKDSGVTWIGEIPEEWNLDKLGNYFTERKEKVSDIDYQPLSVSKGGIVQQLDGVAKTKNNDDRKRVAKGDFAINSRSDRKQSCGLSSLDGSVSVINTVLTPRSIEPDFVKYLLDNYGFAEEFFRWGSGIHFDLWSTRFTQMKSILLPVPNTKEEQQKIASYLDQKVALIDNIIEKTKQSIEEYKKYKQSLITETVTKGLNPDVKMKDSGIAWIGEIPEHWEVKNLKYLGFTKSGLGNKKPEDFGHGYPFISYKNIYSNFALDCNCEDKVASTESDRLNYSVLRGDAFFTGSSETIEELGISSMCLEDIPNATFNGFSIRFRPYTLDVYSPNFMMYYFRSFATREHLVRNDNSITRANLSQKLLNMLSVLIPPIEEQVELSEYIDKKVSLSNDVIKNKEMIITELEAYKKSLIYEVVTGKKEII